MKKADGVTFSKLCEEHLSVKPSLARGGCIRLGRRDEHRPRRLLVHLTSEFNAASVLAAAKKLRQCDDDYISRVPVRYSEGSIYRRFDIPKNYGIPWYTMVYHSISWYNIFYNGIPPSYHVKRCHTCLLYTSPSPRDS